MVDTNLIVISVIAIATVIILKRILFEIKRKQRKNFYRNNYLKSEEWRRKRFLVLKRDNWSCVYCGERATQVHHKKYAKKNIGKEPIKWLVSICDNCHHKKHR